MATYKSDPAHSEATFKVKHMMISSVSGNIGKFDVTMEADRPDFTDASVTFNAETSSITTHHADRDKHLMSDDFFNADRFPQISFKSTQLQKISGDSYILKGDLTIRDITNPVELRVTYHGSIKDTSGITRFGFEVEGKVNRHDYNLRWNELTETGGFIVGPDVSIFANVEMMSQP